MFRSFLIGLSVIISSSCSLLLTDHKDDYLKEKQEKSLSLPENIVSRPIIDYYPINSSNTESVGSEYDIPMPQQVFSSGASNEVRMHKLGQVRWVYVETLPSSAWPMLNDFWVTNDITIARSDPTTGIIESANLGNEGPESKLVMKVEHGIRQASSEIFISHLTFDVPMITKLVSTGILSIFKDNTLINQFYSPVNLDDLPFPDWSEYSKRYPLRNDFFSLNQKIAVPILATRGCPYSCFNYCTYPLQQGRKVRARSVENLIKEIKHWQKEIGTNKFVFRDPVFSINRKHTISLCEEIIKQKLNITFMVETHLNNMDDQMIKLLKQAGLELIYVGVESSNHVVLKDMKRFTIEHDKQYEIIKKCQDAGIIVKTMFIIGNPEDTEDTINASIQYSKYLPSLYAQFSVFTPYPGTPVYSDFKELINVEELEKFNQYNLVFKHKNLTAVKIEKLKSLAYLKFYFDLKRIFRIFFYLFRSKYM